jgi:hypothetical protein
MHVSLNGRVLFLLSALLLLSARPVGALDFFDERIQIHGSFEQQVRAISDDLNAHLDLTQWYSVLNIEIDLDIAKDGWGPFDSIGAFVRGEVRYDCVWTRACGISGGTNVFGNRSRVLPSRLSRAQNTGFAATTRVDTPTYRQPSGKIATQQVSNADPSTVPPLGPVIQNFRGFNQLPAINTLLGVRTVLNGIEYFPASYTFQRFLNYGFALRDIRGNEDFLGTQVMPWDPKDDVDPHATLRDRVNPFRAADINPITGQAGSGALPYRPAPMFGPGQGSDSQAQGLYYPSVAYARYAADGGSDWFQQNFSQEDLAWNRGASQSQTKELKEAYLDLTLLDGALFARLGRQTIVWGKTELFATTDLFNPNDLALGSLTKLEESRIPIWAARVIYSFYEVGPLSDVRLELAADLDTFYPDDLGRCGEPYTPNPVCDKTFGLMAHGLAGLGVAGEDRPPHWWNDIQGFQGGVRLEFRWDRFSFALVDFWNYDKIPFQKRLGTYSRSVDPNSGRPSETGAPGSCPTGNEPGCLTANEALTKQTLNQQYFAFVCSASVGFSPGLDSQSCAQSVLTTSNPPAVAPIFSIPMVLSQFFSGSPNGIFVAKTQLVGGTGWLPTVALSVDPGDGPPTGFFAPLSGLGPFSTPGFAGQNNHRQFQTLAQTLTPAQQSLLGCGAVYGTSCDGGNVSSPLNNNAGGIDLLNAEASALVQSWIGIEGTPLAGMLATDPVSQPGTAGFAGGPVCTRFENGRTYVLPGCRPFGTPGYNPAQDGPRTNGSSPTDGTQGIGFAFGQGGVPAQGDPSLGPITFASGHPFTGQAWNSELAALSWNFEMVLVAFSTAGPNSNPKFSFDPNDPYRTTGCSYVAPQFCSSVRALWDVTGVTRNDLRAGGTARFGRRDFVWASGGEVVLSYQRKNVLGLSSDFAEDFTKSNWGMEFTWVNRVPFEDASEFDGITKTGTYNLTISVDRPTFVNFLNQTRTFFFNTQWFIQYNPGYKNSFRTNGPWETLFTFTVQTGYFQDRLLPDMTWVYDFQSNSGAVLPAIQYRFTESFSATFGLALFWGRYQSKEYPVNPLATGNQVGRGSYTNWVENGLAVIRQRDEIYFNLRYTF